MAFRKIFKKYKWDLFLILLILCLAPLFFFKLGQSSLVSWDEAWYAAIARNIINSGNFLQPIWNGNYFYDHPPAGFWWIATSFKFFGVNNFSARLPSAIFGLGTLVATYFLGKELFNRWVGFAAALALVSAPWFLFRSRSGDLDIFLTFFFAVSTYFAAKSVRNKKYFVPLGISLGLLFLTKTIVPLTIIPALVIIFWGTSLKWKDYRPGLIAFSAIFLAWFFAQIITGPTFILRYFKIGLPGISVKTQFIKNFYLLRDYIHIGIGKWFWPGVFSIFANLVWRKKSFLVISAFCLSFFAPFLFSAKTQIWHLIPAYPFFLISLFSFGYYAAHLVTKSKILSGVAIILIAVYFSFFQSRSNWYQFINIPAYISDEEILSREAGKYSGPLYIDGDFVPAAVFYSGKDRVEKTYVGGIADIFDKQPGFLLITTEDRLRDEKISENRYEILKSDRDKILVIKI
ncbi:MAG TPA: glycosyltransferase family 39 protein [Patescibacteria group bacterium]|nr:glycosyltransferase family 39 protein [Patescibacteria group bacterium]